VHIPLGELIQSFLDSGVRLERFEEVGGIYPPIVALRGRK
jgi:hypothetical protein